MKKTKIMTLQSGQVAKKKIHSEKNHDVIYTMMAQIVDGNVKLSCSCKGWIYQCQQKGTLCKHLKAHKEELEMEIRGAIAVSQVSDGGNKMAVLGSL